jgi:hypothetical protein
MKTITMPQDTTVIQAGAVAAQHGCVLRAENGRIYMKRARHSLDSAFRAVDQGRFAEARSHLNESHDNVEAFIVAGGATC